MNKYQIDFLEQVNYEQVTYGKKTPSEHLKLYRELVDFYSVQKATEDQSYKISKFIMNEIVKLLQMDGINSKKEVLGILQTYVEEDK